MKEKNILVLYLNVGELESGEIQQLSEKISSTMFPKKLLDEINSVVFIVPVRDSETRLECIHPNFVVDADVYSQHTERMKKLNDEIKIIVNQQTL